MIADSPYEVEKLILTPRQGFLWGLLGALLMLIVTYPGLEGSATDLAAPLRKVGSVFSGATDSVSHGWEVVGAAVHFALGGSLGLLYAASQQRIPKRGLVGVGLFYGFFIWIVSRALVELVVPEAREGLFVGPRWLLACLIFGLFLAIVSVATLRFRPRTIMNLPQD